MKKLFLLVAGLFFCLNIFCQHIASNRIQKNGKVEGAVVNAITKEPMKNELVIFKSIRNKKEYKIMTNDEGKLITEIPAGDEYEIIMPGYKDSINRNVLEIPALDPGDFYENPFLVQLEVDPIKIWVLENVEFDFRKADLDPQSYPALDQLANYLQRKNEIRIEIRGFTDNVGNEKANLKLSERRAQSVADYLEKKGISGERMMIKGYGDTLPVTENNSEEGRQKNRRIEIKFLHKEE